MASSGTQDEVNQSQSVGDSSSIDVHASQLNTDSADSGAIPSTSTINTDLSHPLQDHAPTAASTESASHQAHEHTDGVSDGKMVYGTSMLNGDRDSQAESRYQENSQEPGLGGGERETSADERSVSNSHPDPNVGSDTDTSRADGAEQGNDGQDKIYRLGAMKKPTSFKSVSVTKSFLAKTASTPPTMTVKIGEKSPAVAALQSIAKPRLVAKSGSGIRDSPRPRLTADGASDGATVWNKNRREF